jgi:hypothetical protein
VSGSADFFGEKVVKYARVFLENRMETFHKDVERCLMGDRKVDQAYFPALMTCIGFTEFMSGLHAGNLESGNDLDKLEKYSKRFLPEHYDKLKLKILYGFRHKLSHLAYPHGVIILTEKWKRRRIAWEVFANEPRPPIQIDDFATPKYLKHSVVPPWKVPYDCKVTIGLRAFFNDIVESVAKYLDALKSDRKMQDNFAKCIRKIFPPDDTGANIA